MSCTIASDPQAARRPGRFSPALGRLSTAAGIAILLLLAGCGGTADLADEEEPTQEFTYICTKTGEKQVGPLRNWPYQNPAAAGAEFMLSLHCGKCSQWHAVPPPDKGRGNPLAYRCPKTGAELSVTAPKK